MLQREDIVDWYLHCTVTAHIARGGKNVGSCDLGWKPDLNLADKIDPENHALFDALCGTRNHWIWQKNFKGELKKIELKKTGNCRKNWGKNQIMKSQIYFGNILIGHKNLEVFLEGKMNKILSRFKHDWTGFHHLKCLCASQTIFNFWPRIAAGIYFFPGLHIVCGSSLVVVSLMCAVLMTVNNTLQPLWIHINC